METGSINDLNANKVYSGLSVALLAPYLPYQLQINCGDVETEMGVMKNAKFKLCNINLKPVTELAFFDGDMLDLIAINEHQYMHSFSLCEVKPILRPLSDLTKEIEHNGEKFVPADILFPVNEYKSEYERKVAIGTLELQNAIAQSCTYFGVVQKLFEWHFDVFGLIDDDLAVAY